MNTKAARLLQELPAERLVAIKHDARQRHGALLKRISGLRTPARGLQLLQDAFPNLFRGSASEGYGKDLFRSLDLWTAEQRQIPLDQQTSLS